MNEMLKRTLVLALTFVLSYGSTAFASYRFTDDSNVEVADMDDVGNFDVQGASVTAGKFVGDGSLITGVTSATADALTNNPTDCSANQFANAIAANGDLTCAALADADVPDSITITLAATATALAANGANCSANQFNKGVDASGVAESCAALVDADVPDSITVTLAATATALAADPADAGSGHVALGITADGTAVLGVVDATAVNGSTNPVQSDGLFDHTATAAAHHTKTTDASELTSGELPDARLSANVSLLGSSISVTETDFIELKDTTANICADVPSATAMIAISTDEFDMFISTGNSVAGQYRNTRTGAGPC